MEIRALLSAMWRTRTGPLLVAAQVAITLAVVVNVAYIVQQRLADANKPTGIDLDNMFWIGTAASSPSYDHAAVVRDDLAYLNGLPGVIAATIMNQLPQTWASSSLPFAADPKTLLNAGGGEPARFYWGDEKLLEALGLELVAGRNFDPNVVGQPLADSAAVLANWAPEVVVTQALAKKLFPDGNALGKTIYAGLINKSSTIVGIVDYMQAQPLPARLEKFVTQIVFVPVTTPGPSALYIIRVKPGQRDAIMAKVEAEFADREPNRFVERMEAYDKTAKDMRQGTRGSAVVLATVGICVLAVTVIGIVGLAAFNVTTRTKQLGTRRAIGARKFHILRYFLVENWLMTTGGALIGCALALAAGVYLATTYQLARLPLFYIAGGVVLLWAIGLLAVLVPARRAASISPAVATRTV
jgi:putative ABC transport system permease protein